MTSSDAIQQMGVFVRLYLRLCTFSLSSSRRIACLTCYSLLAPAGNPPLNAYPGICPALVHPTGIDLGISPE